MKTPAYSSNHLRLRPTPNGYALGGMEAAIMDRHIRDFVGFAMVMGCATCADQRHTTVKALARSRRTSNDDGRGKRL